MDLTPIWGSLTVFIACPLLGGIPLIDWITYAITGRQLKKLGTGNVSVSAAFYHGGKLVGVLAVISEAAKGIIAVLLTRLFFPNGSVWEIMAIIAVVMGRYWMGKSAGTTNAVWGIVAHDPIAAGLTWLISLVSFTIIRDRLFGKYGALVLLVVIIALRNPERWEYGAITLALACLLGWIYQNIPDDLELTADATASTNRTFRFFQGDSKIITLDSKLDPNKVGSKAANLSLLKRQGYPVVEGWVLCPGDNLTSLVATLNPTLQSPLIVRSSAIGEDSETASAAGQYLSILNVSDRDALESAIIDCQTSYLRNNAVDYRRQTNQAEAAMAILVQKQIAGVYSGVAFSRDPVNCFRDRVAVEALPGKATKIVSGKFTPQRYSVLIPDANQGQQAQIEVTSEDTGSAIGSTIDIPPDIIESVALLAREMEDLFEGIPQDIEWTYDGEKIWLLQVRPIVNLQPIWTRRIAAEVIPGKIKPLTWSINQPLTCGVWGKLFTVVLGDRAKDLNFEQTATLHFASAYFNASLLGEIFLRMGLPPESLEFLTRGAKFSKPPLSSTLRNLPGLWRLGKREWKLGKDFNRDRAQLFEPILAEISAQPVEDLSAQEIIARIETILGLLDKATYYNILAPLSLAIRQGLLKVDEAELDNQDLPEVDAVASLAEIAGDTRKLLANEKITFDSSASLFAHLAENPEGSSILKRFDLWLTKYGYLSEVATDIAIPRWGDKPRIPRKMFTRFFFDAHHSKRLQASNQSNQAFKTKLVQRRLGLKGQVAQIYNQLLAQLRWSFLALEQQWLDDGIITNLGDIFLLKLEEITAVVTDQERSLLALVELRKKTWQQEQQLTTLPQLIYGYPDSSMLVESAVTNSQQEFRGIGASAGQIEGSIRIVSSLEQDSTIDSQTIIVVPYTDAGWSPILARAGGLISEVGGRLSHGAIVAREYKIPAVMDVANATHLFRDGQRVRLNGQTGTVEILG